MSNNPYRAGKPVGGTESFIGRAEVLQAIKTIVNDEQNNTLLLWGQRRIGKTSILKQLETQLSNEYHVIFVDWHDKTQWTLRKVLEELAFIISDHLAQAKPVLGSDTATDFQQWLAEQSSNQNKPIIFLFDEFDTIASSKAANEIIGYFGQLLILNPQRLKWLFVIGCKLENLTSQASRLFERMESKFISYLAVEETHDLILLSKETLQWPDPTIERIRKLTAGHPYFIQHLCYGIWEHFYKDNPSKVPEVTLQVIETVIPKTLEATHAILESLWRSFNPIERVVASALAQKETWPALIKRLKRIAPNLNKARESLVNWDLIRKDKGNYRFQVEIIRQWVESYKSLFNELDEIDQNAQSIYVIAQQLLKEKHVENSKILLEQVVQLNPYHTKAHELLVKILIEKKQLGKAEEVLINLRDYNPNSASELETNLKLAQQQEAKKWRRQVKKFYDDHSKNIWRVFVVFMAFLVTYLIYKQTFPSNIILEVRHHNNTYELVGIPSSDKDYHLQFIKLTPALTPVESPSFIYEFEKKRYKVGLIKDNNDYFIDKGSLLKELPHVENLQNLKKFNYPDKDNLFDFEFSLTFPEETNHPVNFKCEVATIDKRAVSCDVKERGYFSVYRGVQWWWWGTLAGMLLMIMIEIIYIIRRKEKNYNEF